MEFDPIILEDRLLARYQQAVDAGLLAWAGLIGTEAEASKMPKLPGVSILLRRGGLSAPRLLGNAGEGKAQEGIIEWTLYAGGQNLRERGKRTGRRGDVGAYYALSMAMRLADGFIMTLADDLPGFPLWIDSFDLATFDQPTGLSIYEIAVRHEWAFDDEGSEE